MDDAVIILTRVLASAHYVDMPDVIDQKRKVDSTAYKGNTHEMYSAWLKASYEQYTRRPYYHELTVEAMFPQLWGSTALGFGGIGGQAMTTTYTTVIGCDNNYHYCVYFGSRLAYKLDLTKCDYEQIMSDIAKKDMAEVAKKGKYLKKKD